MRRNKNRNNKLDLKKVAGGLSIDGGITSKKGALDLNDESVNYTDSSKTGTIKTTNTGVDIGIKFKKSSNPLESIGL